MPGTVIRCPECSLEVLEGRDDLDPRRLLLDPRPLDPMSELGAVLLELETYELAPEGRATYRTPFAMRHRPAGQRPRRTVHARHRCTAHSGR